jgi:hypothetical protein
VTQIVLVPPNASLQLRRAISIQAEEIRLLEKHAIAPSAARLCYVAVVDIKTDWEVAQFLPDTEM